MRLNKKITAFACGLIALTGFAISGTNVKSYAAKQDTNELKSIRNIANSLSQNSFRIQNAQ